METSWCFVVIKILFYERRFTARQLFGQIVGGWSIYAALGIFPTLLAKLFQSMIALFWSHNVIISPWHHPGHVAHASSSDRLYPFIDRRCIQCKARPSADTDYTDPFPVNIFLQAQIANCCTEIFRVDVWWGNISGWSTTLLRDESAKKMWDGLIRK